ncbi:MAG: CZB domain-containing protein [Deltaproteobacteria bacterium]|nr:CZB domain-containing protein [Deltaproteobacteria bacterium]
MSDVKDHITKAVGAHGLWKARLREAIGKGTFDTKPEIVERCDACEFGKWLEGLAGDAASKNEHYPKVHALHADFHKSAAAVVRLVLRGDKAGAVTSLDGAYADISGALTGAMMRWRAAV